jgi:hypothetical protein
LTWTEAKVNYPLGGPVRQVKNVRWPNNTDVDLTRFSVAHVKGVIATRFDLEEGYLRVKVKPEQEKGPRYYDLIEEYDGLGDEDDRLLAIME